VDRHFSETEPEYLELLADFLDWKADQNEKDAAKQKFAPWDRRDAQRARGWAVRLRSGAKARAASKAAAATTASRVPDYVDDPHWRGDAYEEWEPPP
jgi:hypothetical protein